MREAMEKVSEHLGIGVKQKRMETRTMMNKARKKRKYREQEIQIKKTYRRKNQQKGEENIGRQTILKRCIKMHQIH
jgi:hypothetical protein